MKRFLSILGVLMVVSFQSLAAADMVTLNVTLITGHDAFKSVIDTYTKSHPNVKVVVTQTPTDTYTDLIKIKFAGGDAPDILPVFSDSTWKEYAKIGKLLDLSVMKSTVARLAKGADTTLRTNDGALIAFPAEQQLIFAYYNRDLFKSLNIQVPRTWDEFLAACKAIKAKGIVPLASGFKDEWTLQMIPYALSPSLVHNKYPDFHKGTLTGTAKFSENKGWIDIMTKMQNLVSLGYIPKGSLSTSWEQSAQMFATGKAAIMVNGTWAYDTVRQMNPKFEIGGFPVPPNKGDALGASSSINGGYGIYAKSANIEAAKDLLAYMVSAESLKIYLSGKGPSPFADVEVELVPCMAEVVALEKGAPLAQFDAGDWLPGVQDVFMKESQLLVAGTLKPLDVLKHMDDATQKALKK